MSLAEPIAIH